MGSVIGQVVQWLGHAETRGRDDSRGERFIAPSGKTIEIRAGKPGDATAITPMIERTCALHQGWDAAKFGFVADAVPMYRTWLAKQARDPHSVFVVAAIESRLVAFLIATTEHAPPIFRPDSYGFVRDLWVEEDYRHYGIGQRLMHATVERFRAVGITQIRLETATANDAARRFFASCGFRPSATEMLIE